MQGEHRITRHETRPPAPESALTTLQLLPRTEQITAVHRLDPRHRFPPPCFLYILFRLFIPVLFYTCTGSGPAESHRRFSAYPDPGRAAPRRQGN